MIPADTIANEIIALINSQPRSPTFEEIRAVLEKVETEFGAFWASGLETVEIVPGGVLLDEPAPKVEVKRLTYSEFDALVKLECKPAHRDSFFQLSRWEDKPDEVVVFWAKPFALFADRDEHGRGINGKLPQVPRLYVAFYCEEQDEMRLACIAWEAARVLKPERTRILGDALWAFRKERAAERYGVARDDPRLVAALANPPSKRISDAS